MFWTQRDRASRGRAALTASPFLAEYHDTRYARALIWTIAAALVGFVIWAAQAPVYEMVAGQGMIKPEGLSRRVEHRDGGIVAEILVAEGAKVSVGDPLIRLDTSDLVSERRKLAAQVDRLEQEIRRYDTLLGIDLGTADAAALAAALEGADRALAEDLSYRAAQIDVLRREREVAAAQLSALAARRDTLAEEIAILDDRRRRYAEFGTDLALSRRDVEDLERELLTLRSTEETFSGERALAQATIARARSRERELVGAYRREAAASRADAAEALTTAQETIAQIEERLARASLRAPVSGVVNDLAVQGAGEVIGAGETVAEIVPLGGRAFAEIEIPAERIGGVNPGDEASLQILTYDFTRYGDVAATVDRISPSSFELEDGRNVFRVALAFEASEVNALDDAAAAPRPIGPGMTVMASVKSDRRTVLSYLLKPLRIISERGFTEG